MAFVSSGYDGTVDEKQFANILERYAVKGPDAFKASAVAGADRTLSIANGNALGPGTFDEGTSFAPIQFDAVTSGTTRWDLVVLRRDWQPPGGNTSIVIIKGGATKVLPARTQNPGVIDDQPLYLQQVNAGSTSLGTRVDLRVWVGAGGAEAADVLALTYLNQPGAAVKVGQTTHRYEIQGNGVWGWGAYGASTSADVAAPSGWSLGPAGFTVTKSPLPTGKSLFHLSAQLVRQDGAFAIGNRSLGALLPAGFRPLDNLDFHAGLNTANNLYLGSFSVRVTNAGTFILNPINADYIVERFGNINFSGTWVA